MPRKYRGVLSYLREMEQYCREEHRHDLEGEYQEAWEVAARTVYGKLPPRPEVKANHTPAPVAETGADRKTPVWRKQMLAKPLRKVVAVLDDYLLLQCGHRVWEPFLGMPDQPQPRHRRCDDCARATQESEARKKKPAPASTASKSKGASA